MDDMSMLSEATEVSAVAHEYGVPAEALAKAVEALLDSTSVLSAGERDFLVNHGGVPAHAVDDPTYRLTALVERRQATNTAWADVRDRALTAAALSDRYGWHASNISRMLRTHDLYAVKNAGPNGGHLFPEWQFTDATENHRVPGLRHILMALPLEWHPMDVEEWMTSTNENMPRGMSPLAWLTTGGDPKVVVAALDAELRAW